MRVYADNAATTKLCKAAKEAMEDYYENIFGNPSSQHIIGREAASALQFSRQTISSLLGCNESEVFFTSGGSESNNQAIYTAEKIGKETGKKHIISSTIEHPSVINSLNRLKKHGFSITLLDVSKRGFVNPNQVENALRDDTCFVSIMYANNEIGTIQPIREIADICEKSNVLFHTDAVQAAGHININIAQERISMLSLSAHKFHGPKGIGVLYCKNNIQLAKMLEGGLQENNKRAGTENVPAIVGMTVSLKESLKNLEEKNRKIKQLTNCLLGELLAIKGAFVNGDLKNRLCGNINICFPNVNAESLMIFLSGKGICVSTGSACSSGSITPSHVLLAIGNERIAKSSIRISLSEYNTMEEVEYIASSIKKYALSMC